MPKAIYIIAVAVIAWILFSGKKANAVIYSVLKNAQIPESEANTTTTNANTNITTTNANKVKENVPSIYTPPPPGELVKVKPYEGTEVFGTYSEGNATRPVSEYYQKLINDRVLIAMYSIFDNHNNPEYKLVDAINESLATGKPVWLVVLLHARAEVENGKLEKIGHFENGVNGAFGSISQAFRANIPENVAIANANIYLTRQTNGLFLKAQYAAGANGVPFWREVYNMALAITT